MSTKAGKLKKKRAYLRLVFVQDQPDLKLD